MAEQYAAILDNNYPGRFELTPREQFVRLWAGYGGFALSVLQDPASSLPYRSYEVIQMNENVRIRLSVGLLSRRDRPCRDCWLRVRDGHNLHRSSRRHQRPTWRPAATRRRSAPSRVED